ncbi:adenine phosphoribosyltransferase [Hwanghaeella grinnelliae]|uniref:Adenine phosphoribosyltransferase n=1 Tax=Hwanghaeella grinnelliae TaxID=2500179 RepID=A0A3S2Y4C1_9PROT|nr:BtpA/SgcQ family protein [Hwanghaeella grinnelliae]RVU38190.1 adenine phosphoribosyltransferase [Hwanghaeella grinnelliae]
MNRKQFHTLFACPGPVVTPVIHVVDFEQVDRNVRLARSEGVHGIFLINHDFGIPPFLPIIRAVRKAFPDLWLGVNFLAVTGADAFPILGELESDGCRVDAYWADDARIDERTALQNEAQEIAGTRRNSGWSGLYFGGTAFKKQRPVDPADYEKSAQIAAGFMDVVTTSGIATGHEADLSKIADFRRGAGDHALALASGITPENVDRYKDVDCLLVATGINREGDFYNIDAARLAKLMRRTEEMEYGLDD